MSKDKDKKNVLGKSLESDHVGTLPPRSKSWNVVKDCTDCVKSRLKSELSWLRRKGSIKGQDETTSRSCGRCQTELGLIINRGAICSSCRQRVCKECRKYGNYGREWVCVVCSKQIEIQQSTGEWNDEFVRRPSRKRDKPYGTTDEGLRNTLIRRSWSISSPTTSSLDVKEDDVLRRKPPQKPPRKSLASDENDPPWDEQTPEKPPRRYSMSSFDGISVKRQSARFNFTPGLSVKSPTSQYQRSSNDVQENNNIYRNEWPPKTSAQQIGNRYYFYGNERLAPNDNERASTLPRRPRNSHKPYSVDLTDDDPNRFHSIPRTRGSRSPSGPRGRSEPAPLRENFNRQGFANSGHVTTTLIVPSVSSVPCTRSNSFSRSNNVTQDDMKLPTRRNFEPLKNLGRANSSNDFWALTGRGTPGDVKLRDDEGGGTVPQFRRLQMRENTISSNEYHRPSDVGVSASSVGSVPKINDASKRSPVGVNSSRILLPRSNTSITSGFASTGRPAKKTSQTFVRRCKSFQAGSPRRSLEDELSLSPKKAPSGGKVAKFIEEFEKGIQQTFVNMKHKRSSDSFRDTSSLSSRKTLGLNDRSSGLHSSNLSISDEVFDSPKRTPAGDDYKLVFISSDSSKDSEFNSSMDSDKSLHRFYAEDPPEPKKFFAFNNQIKLPSNSESKGLLVDASVNTEGDYLSEYPVTDTEEFSSLDSTTAQPSMGIISPSSTGKYYSQKKIDEPVKYSDSNRRYTHPNLSHLVTPLDTLHPDEIELMLQQTEVVQAEAQALQKALMGAFDSKQIKTPSPRWLTEKGLVHDFSSETYPEGVSLESRQTLSADRLSRGSQDNRFLPSSNTCVSDFSLKDEKLQKVSEGILQEIIYENVDQVYIQRKPSKECKSVYIQTDIVSGDEDDSYETGDYSDESAAENAALVTPAHSSSTPSLLCETSKASLDFVNRGQYECNEGKGQESTIPPSYSYLSNSPSLSPTSRTPTVHLHLASECDYSSVSRLTECELVCGKLDVNRGRSVVATKPSFGQNVSASSQCSAIKPKVNYLLQRAESVVKNNSNITARAGTFCDGPSSPPPENYPCLASGGREKPPHRITASLEIQNTFKMSQIGNELVSECSTISDVNAAEELISSAKVMAITDALLNDDVLPSSGTSEEDTDEEIHVSRSYDVSTIMNDEDEDNSNADKIKLDSSLSDSDTDEEKQSIRRYDVTKVSSDSENENEIIEMKNADCGDEGNVDMHDCASLLNANEAIQDSNLVIENELENCENEIAKSNETIELDNNGSESELNCIIENNNELLFNDFLENETTDLPECDQAIGGGVLERTNERETVAKESIEIVDKLSDEEDNELSESIIENKSETESNLGDVAESNKDEIEIEESDVTSKQNSKDDPEFNENSTKEERDSDSAEGETKRVEGQDALNIEKKCMAVKNASNNAEMQDKIEQITDAATINAMEEMTDSANSNEFATDKIGVATKENDIVENEEITDMTDKELDLNLESFIPNENIIAQSAALIEDTVDNVINCSDDDRMKEICEKSLEINNEDQGCALDLKNKGIEENFPENSDKHNLKLINNATASDNTSGHAVFESVQSNDQKSNFLTVLDDHLQKPDYRVESCNAEEVTEKNSLGLSNAEYLTAKECEVGNSEKESLEDVALHAEATKIGKECKSTEITGSVEVEQGSGSCVDKAVTLGALSGTHETTVDSSSVEALASVNTDEIPSDNCDPKKYSEDNINLLNELKESNYSSESGHSSGEESEGEIKEKNIVKINIAEKNHAEKFDKCGGSVEGGMPVILGNSSNVGDSRVSPKRLQPIPDFLKSSAPSIPLRRAKRSSSSDGLSSSSDIDRSDADASDSADTVIDNNRLQSKIANAFRRKQKIDEANRDSDGPSSADSLLQGADSESQCSDGSEEGNLVTIVAVGEDTIPKHSSQGKIYIRSDSTDSDVQIKPTCIVVTGSSGVESDDDGNDEQQSRRKKNRIRNEITILEVTSEHRKDHVMSVRVTSPESSRSTSPTRKSNVSELQSMILTHRERQQQFRRSPIETSETSGLTNYFTVTLGTDSPLTHRRTNKTPEVRKRKVPDRGENNNESSPTLTVTPTPTLTPSPTHTPSPTVTPTPDHSEGDLLAYEEHQIGMTEDSFAKEVVFDNSEKFDDFDGDFDEHYESYVDASAMIEEGDGTFDSIEDAESIGESNYSETSSEEGYEREEELRGYCKRGYDFTLHTIIEESCEESDYDKKTQEEDNSKRDQSELEKYFFFGLGNGQTDSKKYANEESEYSDTFSETSSSNFSEGMESLDGNCEKDMDPEELASSRLEKYFSGFLGFERQPSIRSVGEESEIHSDESDSVGSDSEGSPSPEQPRKKLFRSRGVRSVSSNRSHDGIFSDGSMHSVDGEEEKTIVSGEDEGSTESEETAFDKGDGQFDTIKRRKKKKLLSDSEKKSDSERTDSKQTFSECKLEETFCKRSEASPVAHENPSKKTIVDELGSPKEKRETMEGDLAGRKYQSRDSGFIGSSDDLLKDKPDDQNRAEMESKEKLSIPGFDDSKSKKFKEIGDRINEDMNGEMRSKKNLDNDNNNNKSENEERSSNEGKVSRSSTGSSMDLPPYSQSKGSHNLSRKDSFNNWSSDEETNIMMNKMRIFFKNMFSSVGKEVQKGQKIKSPQLVMFEARLTNLMRSVPGINDEQVKEIVEYLSSEETWSDSYDSSDYTSSDLEGPYARLDQADPELKSELQEQISASCQQIIKKFDQCRDESDNMHFFFGNRAYSESSEDASLVSKDTAFLCQKIMSSISNMKPDSDRGSIGSGSQSTSPPLLMKVIHHIGDRIVALMHEVSGGSDIGDDVDSFNGGNPVTSSPKQKLFLPKKFGSADAISFDSSIDKSSLTSTSFESEDSPTDTEQSLDSETGTPKIFRRQKLSIISERSSAEDFTSFDSQRTVFSSSEPLQHYIKNEPSKSQSSHGQSYYNPEGRGRWHSVSVDADKFDGRDHVGLPKMTKSGRRTDPRKAKSHLSLEKIHHEDVKTTGERSESLGDLLDRVRSSSEFSSSYEQLDSDSTLKASDSLDRQIGSSSSNIRLNASSRGSLTTSSRGSLAASSRGSLNASSRGSLQGSSGPEEEEDRKGKKLSFFRNARRSSVPDATKDTPSPEMRSTTLPRSAQPQILTTGTLPRSQSSQEPKSHSSSGLLTTQNTHSPAERPSGYHTTGPRSARYHPPGYRPPPAGMIPKRAISTPSLRKDPLWHISDESGACVDDVISASSSAVTSASSGSLSRAPPPPSRLNRMGGGFSSNASSRAASPYGGSLGKTSGNESVGGSLASFDNSPDEDEVKRRDSADAAKSPLIALGPKSRSESLASVCSTSGEGRFGTVPVQGEILVAFQYSYKEGNLECHVQQCRDLAPVDTKRNRSDPYVKAYLLPDKSKSGKRKTKVKRHSLSPVFEEIFKFATTLGELESRTLWLSVWHSDMFGRNVFLGEVLIPLSDAVFEDSSPKWHSLVDRTEPLEDLHYGAVLVVALKFVSPDALTTANSVGSRRSKKSKGALQVRVKEASGLVGARIQTLPDPICKGVLLPERGKSSKQKTNVVRKTNNPRWNHTMTFDDVSLKELSERSLELSIWDHDRFGTSEFMGGCRLNLGKGHHNSKIVEWLDASGLEQKLWEQMLERPNLWVESSMLLRPNIERPIYSSAFTD